MVSNKLSLDKPQSGRHAGKMSRHKNHRSFQISSHHPLKKLLFILPVLTVLLYFSLKLKKDIPVSIQSIPPSKDSKMISRIMQLMEENYVDASMVNPLDILRKASKNLERALPPLLVKESQKSFDLSLGDKKLSIPVDLSFRISDMAMPISHILGFVNQYYQGKPDEEDRTTIALTGATETLDPHTNYMSKKYYNEFKIGTKGNFGGLGIVIGVRQGVLTVISPLEDTPAFKAGVRAKDQIVQINEESTVNMNISEAVDKLRGPVGTKVNIVIKREGEEQPINLSLTRAMIHIQSVAGRMVDDHFGLIRLKNFQQDTFDYFTKMYKSFNKSPDSTNSPLHGLILDLRGNPGGLLDQAIQISDFFLKKGVIVKTVGGHGETLETESAKEGDEGEDIPLVVIINEGSASASEIVSGALKYNDRAIIIGTRSFGKGSVQTVYDLKDGSGLKLTIAHYLTADDQKVQSIGINPDIGLQATVVDPKKIDLFEDVKKREIDLLNEEDDEHKPQDLPPSPYQVSYLMEAKDPENPDDDESAARISLEGDFSVKLAVRVLELEHELKNRSKVFERIPKLLSEVGLAESQKTQEAMKKVGVDWTEPESPKKKREKAPEISSHLTILDKNEQTVTTLKAGDKVTLKLSVENKSDVPLHRLIAVSKSEDPLFANMEFPLGKVLTHATAEWRAPLKIPDFVRPRSIPMDLVFHEANGNDPETVTHTLTVSENTYPLFSYNYTLLKGSQEKAAEKPEKATSLESGETYVLKIQVKNTGNGDSQKPTLNLKNTEETKNEETPFIEKGHLDLSPLKSGDIQEAFLQFRTPKFPEDSSSITMELMLFDNQTGHEFSDRITFPIHHPNTTPTVFLNPLPELNQQPPTIKPNPEFVKLSTPSSAYMVKGTLTDDEEVKHFSIFVGDDKVFYAAPAPGSDPKELPFTAKFPLKKGINLITLTAQDNRDLISRTQWIVWREE